MERRTITLKEWLTEPEIEMVKNAVRRALRVGELVAEWIETSPANTRKDFTLGRDYPVYVTVIKRETERPDLFSVEVQCQAGNWGSEADGVWFELTAILDCHHFEWIST